MGDAFVGIDDREGGTGRVGGGDGGADDDGDLEAGGYAFAGVEAFAAADRDEAVEGRVLRSEAGGGAFNFGEGALAFEDFDLPFDLNGAQSGEQLLAVAAQAAGADVDGGPGAGDQGQEAAEMVEQVGPLHIARRRDEPGGRRLPSSVGE